MEAEATIFLDHTIISANSKAAGAQFLAKLLGRPWLSEKGEFAPVYVSETMTFDFQDRETFTWNHWDSLTLVDMAPFDRVNHPGKSGGSKL